MQSAIDTATAATVRQISHTNTCALCHMHLHNYTSIQTNTRILTLTHKRVRVLATHSHTVVLLTAAAAPPNQHIGFNTEVKKLFVCRDFFCLLPLSLVLLVKNAYK